MKIAVITDDGKTISRHFGRARNYLVATVTDGKITGSELREKMGHDQFGGDHHEHHQHGVDHGHDPAAHSRHAQMANPILDCEVVICGGMGMGAYENLRQLNIQPVVTDLEDIGAAIQAYIEGKLVDHTERLH